MFSKGQGQSYCLFVNEHHYKINKKEMCLIVAKLLIYVHKTHRNRYIKKYKYTIHKFVPWATINVVMHTIYQLLIIFQRCLPLCLQ